MEIQSFVDALSSLAALGVLSTVSYLPDYDDNLRRKLRRYMKRRGVAPAEVLRLFEVPIRIRRYAKLGHEGIPMDLGLLTGGPNSRGGCPGLGYGTPEGFKTQVHFSPDEVARLAWALQLDRLGEVDIEGFLLPITTSAVAL